MAKEKPLGVWYMRHDPKAAEFRVVEPDGTAHVVKESAVFQDYALNRLIAAMARALTQPGFLSSQEPKYLAAYKKIASMGQMSEPVPQLPAVDGATLAGLIASEGHLSALVDQQRSLLVEIEDHFSRGWLGSLEDGESEIIDKVRLMLGATNAAPQPPAPVRQPLTADEIKSLYGESNFDVTGPYVIAFARAVEAAHGITNHETGCGACGDGCKSRGSCRLVDESPEQQAKATEGGAG